MNKEETNINENFIRRKIPARLIETTPDADGLWYWVMASPLLLFIAWLWVDLFAYISPLSSYGINIVLGLIFFLALVVLPAGYLAHLCVTAFPGLFQHAGWDVQPLEHVAPAEQYMVRYIYQTRHRTQNSWSRTWMRSAQGWFYLEIAAIFAGALLVIPLYLSAVEFGFGQ